MLFWRPAAMSSNCEALSGRHARPSLHPALASNLVPRRIPGCAGAIERLGICLHATEIAAQRFKGEFLSVDFAPGAHAMPAEDRNGGTPALDRVLEQKRQ